MVRGDPFLPAPVDRGGAVTAPAAEGAPAQHHDVLATGGGPDRDPTPEHPTEDDAADDARRTRRVTRAEAARRSEDARRADSAPAAAAARAQEPPPF